jgi:hypothetical protein
MTNTIAYTLVGAGIIGFMFGGFPPTICAIFLVGGLLLVRGPIRL